MLYNSNSALNQEANASVNGAILRGVSEVETAQGMPFLIYITFYNFLFKDYRRHE